MVEDKGNQKPMVECIDVIELNDDQHCSYDTHGKTRDSWFALCVQGIVPSGQAEQEVSTL